MFLEMNNSNKAWDSLALFVILSFFHSFILSLLSFFLSFLLSFFLSFCLSFFISFFLWCISFSLLDVFFLSLSFISWISPPVFWITLQNHSQGAVCLPCQCSIQSHPSYCDEVSATPSSVCDKEDNNTQRAARQPATPFQDGVPWQPGTTLPNISIVSPVSRELMTAGGCSHWAASFVFVLWLPATVFGSSRPGERLCEDKQHGTLCWHSPLFFGFNAALLTKTAI